MAGPPCLILCRALSRTTYSSALERYGSSRRRNPPSAFRLLIGNEGRSVARSACGVSHLRRHGPAWPTQPPLIFAPLLQTPTETGRREFSKPLVNRQSKMIFPARLCPSICTNRAYTNVPHVAASPALSGEESGRDFSSRTSRLLVTCFPRGLEGRPISLCSFVTTHLEAGAV